MTCVDGIACMGGHRPDGLRSVESAEGHCQAEGERKRGGQLPVSTAPLLPYQLVGGRSMFWREGEERKEAVASGNV